MIRGYKNVKWNRLLTMEASIIWVPDSQNRMGIDPWPKFHIRIEKLLGYQKVSFNSSSVNNGYLKSEKDNFYVKNIEKINTEAVDVQFQMVKNSPPYGFSSEGDYEEFVRTTFDIEYSTDLQFTFFTTPEDKRSYVSAKADPSIGKDYYKVLTQIESIEEFSEKKYFSVAEPKNFTIIN